MPGGSTGSPGASSIAGAGTRRASARADYAAAVRYGLPVAGFCVRLCGDSTMASTTRRRAAFTLAGSASGWSRRQSPRAERELRMISPSGTSSRSGMCGANSRYIPPLSEQMRRGPGRRGARWRLPSPPRAGPGNRSVARTRGAAPCSDRARPRRRYCR